MDIIFQILSRNIFPVFILIFLGFLLSRKFKLDIMTLSKLNFYIFTPAFIFHNIYSKEIPLEMVKVFICAAVFMVVNYLAAIVIAKIRKYDKSKTNAFKNSLMFYNSGNIGLPLVTLVFSGADYITNGTNPYLSIAVTVQIMVLVLQSITVNTIGFLNAGNENMHFKDSMKKVLGMPGIYVIILAFMFKMIPSYDLSKSVIWPAIIYIKDGLIPVALMTLGVQLSKTSFNFKDKEIYLASAMRLVGGPIFIYFLIIIFGFHGVIAQALMISSAVPTAVNTSLIAVECNNSVDYSTQIVVNSTIFSSLSLIIVILLARILFPV
ncbi:AEC family transporter [Clostridium sp.]|uniref:AEC family transporter n=1 Tax=Clostridium sp. TaxID=1506 RepID=UPI001A384C1C|nr:AEC family transporter [Clostridium sp.]MBK5242100.1 AEC family transporter [Clostridium sp.]